MRHVVSHTCPRCGLESRRRGWVERHPVAAVLLVLPAGYTLIGVILAYPWFVVPLLVVACAVWVDGRLRRRAGVVARADWEYRREMLAAVRDSEAAFIAKMKADAAVMAANTAVPIHSLPTRPLRAGRRA